MKLPETDEEITEFIRAVDAGEIECPPAPNAKLMVRLCVQQTQIEKLELECTRLHGLWHSAEEKAMHLEWQRDEARREATSWRDGWATSYVPLPWEIRDAALASESQREAAGTADEKPDGQAENDKSDSR